MAHSKKGHHLHDVLIVGVRKVIEVVIEDVVLEVEVCHIAQVVHLWVIYTITILAAAHLLVNHNILGQSSSFIRKYIVHLA